MEEVYKKKINATFVVVNNHIQNIHFVNALNKQKKFCGMNNKNLKKKTIFLLLFVRNNYIHERKKTSATTILLNKSHSCHQRKNN